MIAFKSGPAHISALLVISAVLGVVSSLACTGAESDPLAAASTPSEVGEVMYDQLRCGGCHGEELEGSRGGPALTRLSEYWNQDTLSEYLDDPIGHRSGDHRLIRLSEPFAVKMIPVRNLEPDHLEGLTMFLLEAGSPK